MSNRKLIRPDHGPKPEGKGGSLRRKPAPPERTGAEEFYYQKQMSRKTTMVVVLNNDEKLEGWIEWYDQGAIKLNRKKGPHLLIPRHSIRYLHKAEPRRRRAADE